MVGETGALHLSREAGMILTPHQFVELMGRDPETSAKGTAELFLDRISMVASNVAQPRLRRASSEQRFHGPVETPLQDGARHPTDRFEQAIEAGARERQVRFDERRRKLGVREMTVDEGK